MPLMKTRKPKFQKYTLPVQEIIKQGFYRSQVCLALKHGGLWFVCFFFLSR